MPLQLQRDKERGAAGPRADLADAAAYAQVLRAPNVVGCAVLTTAARR